MEKDFRCKELTIGERVKDLLSRLTLDEKIDMLSGHQKAVERLGISEWYIGTEVARGFVSREDGQVSTVTPQPIGMASTFDKELMYKLGEIAGKDARYYHHKNPTGKLMLWGPTVDPERNPLWGRNEEAYGEDTCLAGEMTREYTAGMAGSRRSDEPAYKPITECTTAENGVLLRTVPTLKHFCANNNEEDRGKDNSNATMQLLHEYYYRAFMPALREGGAHSAMASYNKVAGIPGDMNPDIQKILKDKWGMDFSVSDGGAFSQNVNEHRFVRTHAEALALCIKNGMDSMTDDSDIVSAATRDALEKGLITEKDIDLAVGNTLIGRFRLGEFDGDNKYSQEIREPDGKDDRKINLRASLEQVCLLK
ncbi:MAG: glycoside hydrolase family 3 protein, partial [Huintestinicola sp.]